MSLSFVEDTVELAGLQWLRQIGYRVLHGPAIAPGEPAAERSSYREVILEARLQAALARLNPKVLPLALAEAYRQLTRTESPNPVVNNQRFHKLLLDGITVARQENGRTVYDAVRLVDFDHPANNDWLAVNQFSILKAGVVAGPSAAAPLQDTRRPDIILFVNGLPLVVIELKNAADEQADVYGAYKQLQTYKQEIPDLFMTNEALVVADGTDARLGTLTSGWEWFKAWRSVDGESPDDGRPQLETLIKGALAPEHFLALMRYFTVFETHRSQVVKKTAGYHQYPRRP
jgi:type I restriction enzyme, R subunit